MNTPQPIGFCPWTARFEQDAALIHEAALPELTRPLDLQLAEHPFLKEIRDKVRPEATLRPDGIAVLSVQGTLAYRPNPFEMASGRVEDTHLLTQAIERMAADPKCRGLVLDVNSPGGFLTGGPELGGAVKACTAKKPVVAWTGGQMCSLAYMMGSQADVVMSTASAKTGSIGVMATLVDPSRLLENMGVKVHVFKNSDAKFKGMGALGAGVSETHAAEIQGTIEKAFQIFKGMVTACRPGVKDESMRGQTFFGQEAVDAGLVDQLGSLSDATSLCDRLATFRGRKLTPKT